VGDDLLGERVCDLTTRRRPACVNDAGMGMSAFETEARVELDAEIGEVGDPRRRLARQDGDGARAAETPAGGDRVLGVQGRIVIRADRRRDATLREVTRRRLDRPLREHDHVGLVRGAESGIEACYSAPHDEEIALSLGRSPAYVSHLPLVVFASESITVPESNRVSAPGSKTSAHVTLAVVFQVRAGKLQALLWQRAKDPDAGAWSLPGGYLDADETLEQSIRRHLAAKVDVRELSHLEQLETLSEPGRHPRERQLATAYLGVVPLGVDPALPEDTNWHSVDRLPELAFDHREITLAGRERLRAKLSYTNIGFALAPKTFTLSELRDIYSAALGHDVSATNLQRVLLRRGVLETTGKRRESGRTGGRPAALFRFSAPELEVTDQFAVLRPPGR
jgi:8-oxo-dGTP diphosphatase